jgi:guanine deaminase
MTSNLQAYRGSLLHFLADPAFSDQSHDGMKMAC